MMATKSSQVMMWPSQVNSWLALNMTYHDLDPALTISAMSSSCSVLIINQLISSPFHNSRRWFRLNNRCGGNGQVCVGSCFLSSEPVLCWGRYQSSAYCEWFSPVLSRPLVFPLWTIIIIIVMYLGVVSSLFGGNTIFKIQIGWLDSA